MKKSIQNPVYLLLLTAMTFSCFNVSGQNNQHYLEVKGKIQGEIKGDVIEKGKEGLIKVTAFQHEIVSPRDVASGQATGKRQHKPLVITKELDKASPLLYKALTTNEDLSEVNLSLYRPAVNKVGSGSGIIQLYFTIKLTDANITGIRLWTNDKGAPMEDVSFTYQKITWTYTNGNIVHEDSWSSKN
jgi:type VI secretion system secreted protein Hcp